MSSENEKGKGLDILIGMFIGAFLCLFIQGFVREVAYAWGRGSAEAEREARP